MRSFAVFLFSLGVSLISALVVALEPDQLFEKVSPSIVVVVGYKSAKPADSTFGSGVIIAPGQIITNCHVIEGADRITIHRNKITTGAIRRFEDPERDLCQISAVDKGGFGQSITGVVSPSELRVGQKVYAIGAPQGFDLTLSDGLISSLRIIEDVGTIIQTNAPISQGSSGGGLFDVNGRLIGITSFQHKAGQNLNFAIPAGWILELPSRHAERIDQSKRSIADLEAQRRELERQAELERQRFEAERQRRVAIEGQRVEEERKRAEAAQRQADAERARKTQEMHRVEEKRRLEIQQIAESRQKEIRERQEKDIKAQEQMQERYVSIFGDQHQEFIEWPATGLMAEIDKNPNPHEFELDWFDVYWKNFQEDREREKANRLIALELERERRRELARQKLLAEQEQQKAKAAAQDVQKRYVDDWIYRIQSKIKNRLIVPPNIEGNPQVIFEIVLLPGGEILSMTLRKSSGNPAYDYAVERAISAAQPLPIPSDPNLFHESFRELSLIFRPKD